MRFSLEHRISKALDNLAENYCDMHVTSFSSPNYACKIYTQIKACAKNIEGILEDEDKKQEGEGPSVAE